MPRSNGIIGAVGADGVGTPPAGAIEGTVFIGITDDLLDDFARLAGTTCFIGATCLDGATRLAGSTRSAGSMCLTGSMRLTGMGFVGTALIGTGTAAGIAGGAAIFRGAGDTPGGEGACGSGVKRGVNFSGTVGGIFEGVTGVAGAFLLNNPALWRCGVLPTTG